MVSVSKVVKFYPIFRFEKSTLKQSSTTASAPAPQYYESRSGALGLYLCLSNCADIMLPANTAFLTSTQPVPSLVLGVSRWYTQVSDLDDVGLLLNCRAMMQVRMKQVAMVELPL